MRIDYNELYSRPQYANDDPRLPETFQKYRIEQKIGEGAVSFVYRVRRLDTGKPVRLKVLRKRICRLAGIREKIIQLDRELQAYRGENILPYHGSGGHDDNLFLEFDYIEAISLRKLIDRDGPFHPDLVALIALGLVAVLQQIHGTRPSPGMGNIIPLHRNLTPENVLITPAGQIVLTDIDMVEIADFAEKHRLQLPYSPLCYRSPEQLLRDYADRRSDIFSLGMLMLEMTCRRLPWVGMNNYHTRQNIRENKGGKLKGFYPKSESGERNLLTRQLGKIIAGLISHNPNKRIQQTVDVEDLLAGYLATAKYRDQSQEIAEFLSRRGFNPQRERQRGFLERLMGK